MSRTHYNSGGKRHGAGGIRLRDTHTGQPDLFTPTVEGMPSYKAREGEAVQIPDLGQRIIETGHFDLGAAAPQVNNNPLAPVDADVIIDTEGITIKNGKLFLQDYGGNSVLGPAGFDGSWVEFVHSGVYNGGFNAGITTWFDYGVNGVGDQISSITQVNGAQSPEDYIASLSAAVPYWITSEYSSTDESIVAYIQSDSTYGRYLAVERLTGAPTLGGYITFTQDVPVVQGREYELDFNHAFESAGGTEVSSIQWAASWRDSEHGSISVGAYTALEFNPAVGQDPSGRHVFNIGQAPVNAKYARLSIRIFHNGNASGLGRLCRLFEVMVRPVVTTSEIQFPFFDAGGALGNQLRIVNDDLRFDLAATGSGYSGLAFRWGGDTDDGFVIGRDGLHFGGGLAVADTAISRVAAGVLSIQGLRLAGAGASFPVSATIGDLYYRTDLGELCEYDGTRWLGQVRTSRLGQVGAATSNSNTDYLLMLSRDVKIVRWRVNTLTQTTNNGSNFWTIRLRDTDRSSLFQGVHGSQSCASFGTVWSCFEVVNSDVVDEANRLGILLDFYKTGSPGPFHMYGDFDYRPVFT